MKRTTALRIAAEVADRLRKANGCIGTPTAYRPYVRVSRLWLFGSTAKGKAEPNDVDLLLDACIVGEYRPPGHGGARLDRERKRRYGITGAMDPFAQADRYLRGRAKMVRIHHVSIDGDLAAPRVMLYPRNMLHNVTGA